MAYAAVTSLKSTLGLLMQSNPLLNLPQHQQHIESLHKEVKEQIQSLCTKVGSLQVLLETLEKNINDRVQRCEAKIKFSACDAEDRIESVLGKSYEATNEKDRRKAYEELCKRLQQACESIDSNSRMLKESMKSSLQATHSSVQSVDLPEQYSPCFDNNMVGHEIQLADMKNTLTETSSNETQIVAIVGMGGIGKTTFARRIYDDPAIRSHFDNLAWVTMSKEYSIRKMLLQLLHCIASTEDVSCEATDDGELAAQLKKRLWKRRYLVVVDDIWNTRAWDDICQWFPDCRGSHVLLTTRCGNVASYAAPDKPPHHMSSLSAKESWELFQSKVLAKLHLSPELLEIGKKIAENCHGVPLIIIVVAGLLSKCNNALDGWHQVAQDVKSAVFKDPGQQCEKVLALSYYYLPQHLRACFLYFGNFPEAEEIHVKELINLWVAEGFIKEADDKSLEDVAEECLHELINRNVVLVSRRNLCGRVRTCRIHDLFYELCLKEARCQNFLSVIDDKPPYRASQVSGLCPTECQRMMVQSIAGFHRINSLPYDKKKVRTVVYQCDPKTKTAVSFKDFKMISVLALTNLSFPRGVPTSLLDLVHLRYLSMTIQGLKPNLLFHLQNLQILIIEIEDCLLCTQPIVIWRMPQLRYLQFKNISFTYFPKMNTGERKHVLLEHLHTITGVGLAWCRREIFARMPNLKKLGIVIELHEYYSSRFLCWSEGISCWPSQIEALKVTYEDFLNPRFVPKNPIIYPLTLKRLTLCNLRLPCEDMDIVGKLPNLEVLKLKQCEFQGQVWEPTSGGFSRLKFLLLDWLDFTWWKATEDHFPVLERLFLSCCWSLKEIPQEFANILTLQVIELNGCDDQLATSAKQIQEEQEAISGGEVTNVRVSNIYKRTTWNKK